MPQLEKIVANLVQKVERRFYGKYRGIVKDNADPENLGRLKVTVPSVLGDLIVVWASPCIPYGGFANQGFLFIPEKETGVWIEFEEGDPEFPLWVGTFWSKPGGESELPKPNDAAGTEEGAVQTPPTCKIIKTAKGHTIQMEDADDKEMVTIVEAKNKHVITMNKDGIKVTDGANKHEVTLDSSGVTITDGKNSGNKIVMESSGLKVEDKNGNAVIMGSSGIKVGSSSAAEPFVLGNMLKTLMTQFIGLLNAHQHIGNMGAPTPIMAPLQLDLTSALSKKNFVE